MLEAGADHIVLGCTHYHFLMPAIRKIAGNKVEVLHPAPAIAQRVKNLLTENNLLNAETLEPRHYFFSDEKPFEINNQII